MSNNVSVFLRASSQKCLAFLRRSLQKHIRRSFEAGRANSQNTRPSRICEAEGFLHRSRFSWVSRTEEKLAARSRKIKMTGEVTPRHHAELKTFSLRSCSKIFKTSERTASSKACWFPNQMFAHSFTIFLSHSRVAPVLGSTWFWSQHALFVASKEIDSNCYFITSKSLK